MNTFEKNFISLLTHDLKGPVGNNLMFMELMESQLSELVEQQPETAAEVDILLQTVRTLTSINQNYYTQIENWADSFALFEGSYESDLENLSFPSFLTPILERYQPMFQDKMMDVEVDIQPISLQGDETILNRMFETMFSLVSIFVPTMGKLSVTLKKSDGRILFTLDGFEKDDASYFEEHFVKTPQLSGITHHTGNGIIKPQGFGLIFLSLACAFFKYEKVVFQDGKTTRWGWYFS